jgi:hypothetical protein
MELPQEGKYVCKLNGQLVIYEASTGSLCAAVPCQVAAPPAHEGFTFKHTMVLVKSDGTVQTKTTDTLKAVFGWDGTDPFWLMDNSDKGGPLLAIEFEIVGGPETGDRGGQYFKSQWLNPLGGGGGFGSKTPVAADRQSVLAKYGSKFRALAAPGAKPAENKNLAPAPRGAHGVTRPTSATPPPPMAAASPSTMEEAWSALNEAQTGKPAEVIEKIWFDTIARLFPNKPNRDLKPHEWGRLKAEVADADSIPM